MQEELVALLTQAIQSANLQNPHPELGVTRLDAVRADFDARHFAMEALKALENGGYKIVRNGEDT